MGFALWIEDDTAWAQGAHEYKPMGAAVIAVSCQFRASDFGRYRNPPSRLAPSFRGLFGSLEEVNVYLSNRPRENAAKRARRVRLRSIL